MKGKTRLLVLDGHMVLDMEHELFSTDFDRDNSLVFTSFVKITTMQAHRGGTLLVCEQWLTTSYAKPFEDLQEWERVIIKKWEGFDERVVEHVNAERTEGRVLFFANKKIYDMHRQLRKRVVADVLSNEVIEYTTDEEG